MALFRHVFPEYIWLHFGSKNFGRGTQNAKCDEYEE